jgi:hypothetical protein
MARMNDSRQEEMCIKEMEKSQSDSSLPTSPVRIIANHKSFTDKKKYIALKINGKLRSFPEEEAQQIISDDDSRDNTNKEEAEKREE